MLTFIIDTATNIGSVALFHEKIGIIGEININVKTNHSALITKLIDSLFQLTEYKVEDIDRVCVTLGPGSFTGIRIGVALAKGLAFSLDKKIVGINELDLLASVVEHDRREIVSMIDARKERAYMCKYKFSSGGKLERNIEYQVGEVVEFLGKLDLTKEYLFVGNGALAYKEIIYSKLGEKGHIISLPNSIPRAGMAGKLIAGMKDDDLFSLEPFYISKSQAERAKIKK